MNSRYLKVCVEKAQKDAVSVAVRLEELSLHLLFNSEDRVFTAQTMVVLAE